MMMANIEPLDRWEINMSANENGEKDSKALDEIPTVKSVFNTYFSIRIDLIDRFKVICTFLDGSRMDITERLKKYGTNSLSLLNIRSYSDGTRPWNRKAGVQSSNNGLLEVVAMSNWDHALLKIGLTGESICQAKKVEIQTTVAKQVQIDSDSLFLNPFLLKIEFFNSALMLTKKKTVCKFFLSTISFSHEFILFKIHILTQKLKNGPQEKYNPASKPTRTKNPEILAVQCSLENLD